MVAVVGVGGGVESCGGGEALCGRCGRRVGGGMGGGMGGAGGGGFTDIRIGKKNRALKKNHTTRPHSRSTWGERRIELRTSSKFAARRGLSSVSG